MDSGLFRTLISFRNVGWSLLPYFHGGLYALFLIFSYDLTFFLFMLVQIVPKSKILFLMENNSCHFPSGVLV